MEKGFKLLLPQMHPGVAEMDAIYSLAFEYNGKTYYDNSADAMCMLSTDCKEVLINGLEVIVPYSFRQAGRTVRITGKLNDYIGKVTDETYYDLSFSQSFSEEPTFFDDFESIDETKWVPGSRGWSWKGMAEPIVDGSDLVFRETDWDHTHVLTSTAKTFSQAFGCFSARLKFPEMSNSECTCNMAFWLASNITADDDSIMFKFNPESQNKRGFDHAGEIDICEYSGAFGDYTAMTYHYNGWSRYHKQNGRCVYTPDIRKGYHIFSLVWVPDALYWYYDGRLVRVIDDETIKDAGKEPGGEMVIILQSGFTYPPGNADFKGTWTGLSDPRDFPMEFRADWVKVHAIR